MDRRKFFKQFGQGTAASIVAPTVLASIPEKPKPVPIDLRQYPLTPDQCYTKGIVAMMEERGNVMEYENLDKKRFQNFVSYYDYCGEYYSERIAEIHTSEKTLNQLLKLS